MIAAVFLGGVPAAVMGVVTILAGWIQDRYAADILLLNVVTYAWFPLIAGITFHAIADAVPVETGTGVFYLLIFGVFVLALLIDFALIAGYMCYSERSNFVAKVRRGLLPLLPSELASAMLALGVAIAYIEFGTEAVALLGVLVLVFQYLIGALLTSQDRADELEVRARQLAGFQVALLSALLRTLDLRDRMTARHSAAVARYSREIAVHAGLPPERAGARPLGGTPARHRQVRAPGQHPQVGPPPAQRRRVGRDQEAPLRGCPDRLADRRLPADRRDHPRPPRAHRRQGLPARPRGRGDPRTWRGSSRSPTPTT